MHHTGQENAMTEIALALAMGFFSIMVLAMVSMSVVTAPEAKPVTAKPISAIALAPATGSQASGGTVKPAPDDLIIIFDRGKFFDAQLKPIDVAAIDPMRPTILAIDPALPLKDVLVARSRIQHPGLIVSTLDDRWRRTLSNRNRGEK